MIADEVKKQSRLFRNNVRLVRKAEFSDIKDNISLQVDIVTLKNSFDQNNYCVTYVIRY